MRNYLKNIEIVGAVLVYQEGEQCRWSIDWLLDNCDRVCIGIDNYNEETEKIILDYAKKYKSRIKIFYTKEPVNQGRNEISGQIKKRFKQRQAEIREELIIQLREMHEEKPIDMLIWPDSDEVFIDEFPKHLTWFWNSDYDHMMTGFVEPYDSMQILIWQRMAPHGRVYRYKPEMTIHPWVGRTRYHPFYNEKKPWKLRHVVVHVCHLTDEYRKRRAFFENSREEDMLDYDVWFLPKDVRKMTAGEIAEYQPGPHCAMPDKPSVKLREYLANEDYYINKYKLKLWTND